MKRVIATVGPSLLQKFPISKIHQDKYIYRINGAHGDKKSIIQTIAEIRSQVKHAEILIDLPGNKIRTKLRNSIQLQIETDFSINHEDFNYDHFHTHLKIGDEVYANDSIFKFIVKEITSDTIIFKSLSNGLLLTNKGLHVREIHADIPFLFEKDLELIEIANSQKVSYVGLSFVRNVDDIQYAKSLIGKDVSIISKVETLAAVKNLDSILQVVDNILVDRGDLSTEIGIEKIPIFQKYILDKGNFYNKKVFLATQFLKNMEEKPLPTFPEVIDLYNTMKSGVHGIQLSEETAIGHYPYECLNLLENVMNEIIKEIPHF